LHHFEPHGALSGRRELLIFRGHAHMLGSRNEQPRTRDNFTNLREEGTHFVPFGGQCGSIDEKSPWCENFPVNCQVG